jgi:hypothetical protein
MNRIKTAIKAISDFAADYADEENLSSSELLVVLSHVYAVMGFALLAEGQAGEKMRDALIEGANSSVDRAYRIFSKETVDEEA